MSDKQRTSSRATIDDVAARAGVSIKTVSRVVNKEPNVRPTTKARVEQAISELAYRPNTAARRLAGNRSYLFALVYDDPSRYVNATANYITNLQGGALKKAREAGYDLLIHPCDINKRGVVDEIKTLIEHARIDGLLLAPPVAEVTAISKTLSEMGKPVVRISPGTVRGFDAVHTNDREICAKMTCYLHSLGHTHIAFIKGNPGHRAMANRALGYEDGLTECGLPARPSLVQQGDNSFDAGVECGRSLLSRKRRPSAIFASNDDMAAGVMQAAHELGLGIPEQVSVAGFDDVPLSRQVWPTLTTIHQPTVEMGEQATELLFRQINGERLSELTLIESTLVIRQSTAPPAKSHDE